MGVFATRSPFRPNPIGLSCVKIESIDYECAEGPVIIVSGADLMDGTPIFDIKPYLPGVDSHPEAKSGFVGENIQSLLEVEIPEDIERELLKVLSPCQFQGLKEILAQDPRPAFHDDAQRIYGLPYAGADIKFKVAGGTATIVGVEALV